jgi:ABC-2 type transport system permease protein
MNGTLSGLASAGAIAAANLRRAARARTTLIQFFLLPIMLIFILGAAFGGSAAPKVGVVPLGTGPLATTLLQAIRAAGGVQVTTMDTEAGLVRAVEHGELEAGLVISADYDLTVAAGGTVALRYLARSDAGGQRISSIVSAVVEREAVRLRAARFAAAETGAPFGTALRAADAAQAAVPQIAVVTRTTGTASGVALEGRFDASAYTQLLLIMFVTALTGSAALIETRRLGLTRRMLTTPTTTWAVIGGETLGRFAVNGKEFAWVSPTPKER